MPRFFFDVFDGRNALRDEFGAQVATLQDAADEAAALLPEMARDALPGRQSQDFAALVRDEEGRVVYRAALLFRGQWSRAEDPEIAADPSNASPEVARAERLRRESVELRRRLSDNVRQLTAVIEASMEARRAACDALGGPACPPSPRA